MCKAIYWGFMSVVSWLLAPVKMRYPSTPFWCLTLSNFKYAQCPEFFHIQHRLGLFYLFYHIQSPRGINFKDIKLKKRTIYNKHREMNFPQFCRYCNINKALRIISLILKIKQCEGVNETLHSIFAQNWGVKKSCVPQIYDTGWLKVEQGQSCLKADCVCVHESENEITKTNSLLKHMVSSLEFCDHCW